MRPEDVRLQSWIKNIYKLRLYIMEVFFSIIKANVSFSMRFLMIKNINVSNKNMENLYVLHIRYCSLQDQLLVFS